MISLTTVSSEEQLSATEQLVYGCDLAIKLGLVPIKDFPKIGNTDE